MARGHARLASALVIGALILLVTAAVLLPGVIVMWRIMSGLADAQSGLSSEPGVDAGVQSWFSVRLAGFTILWTGIVALLALVLAWPAAWVFRERPTRVLPLLLAPMLLPSYLAYAGWGLWRAPGTAMGDVIERAAQDGARWLPGAVGQTLAIVGLALWSFPVAAMLMGASLRSVDRSVIDSLRMERGSALARLRAVVPLTRPWRALGIIWLLMLGSAIPFHVAQMETYAIKVWLAMDLAGPSAQWKPWAQAWPLIVVAIVAGRLIGTRASDAAPDWSSDESSTPVRGHRVLLWVILGVSVVFPAISLISAIREGESVLRFWRVSGPAVFSSLGIAGAVAVLTSTVCIATWYALTGAARRVGQISVVLLLVSGLLPGVLVGSAFAQAASLGWMPRWISDGQGLTVLAHLARFGLLGALGACWLRATEAREERDTRAIDGATDPLSVWRVSLLPRMGVILGAGGAAGMLSFHEIEASILLRPPTSDNFPRHILNLLHFWRTEELSVAALWLLTVGTVVALGISWGLARDAGHRVASRRAQGQ